MAQFTPYCGLAPGPGEWLTRWNLDPVLLLLIAAFFGACLLANRRLLPPRLLAGGVFAILFVSPFCALGSALFSARAVHHIVLVTVLAPLLVAAFDLHRRRWPVSLPAATALQAAILWLWHIPALYASALSSDTVFWLMQVSIIAGATLWWARLRQAEAGGAVLALLATMVQMGVLGALLTFSGRALYAPHFLTTQSWSLSVLEDQQIAGILMWAPASAIYLLAALAILYRALGATPGRQAAT